jgi:CRP-like cAMP-binding protein
MSERRPTDVLAAVPAFAGCSRQEVRRVARYTLEERHPQGAVLIEEGAEGDQFFVVVEGDVQVLRGGEVVDTLGQGQFFGEVALLGHAARNATVRAATPVRLLTLPARSFRSLIGRYPAIFDQVVDALGQRA